MSRSVRQHCMCLFSAAKGGGGSSCLYGPSHRHRGTPGSSLRLCGSLGTLTALGRKSVNTIDEPSARRHVDSSNAESFTIQSNGCTRAERLLSHSIVPVVHSTGGSSAACITPMGPSHTALRMCEHGRECDGPPASLHLQHSQSPMGSEFGISNQTHPRLERVSFKKLVKKRPISGKEWQLHFEVKRQQLLGTSFPA